MQISKFIEVVKNVEIGMRVRVKLYPKQVGTIIDTSSFNTIKVKWDDEESFTQWYDVDAFELVD